MPFLITNSRKNFVSFDCKRATMNIKKRTQNGLSAAPFKVQPFSNCIVAEDERVETAQVPDTPSNE